MMFILLGGMMCPFTGDKMHHMAYGGFEGYDVVCFGIKIFFLVWFIAVPIIITSRLDKIVKLLQDKK